ncbi:MAG: potassium transporter [Cyanothece sp. SIO1E1]|nr:potassium transporter [Cyanothece sp. SIO1E1]
MLPKTHPPNLELPGEPDQFLVCGLGSLGQHCVANLKTFGVTVNAVNIDPIDNWEINHLPDVLATFLIGDCRHTDVLEQAGIKQCRAVLLVTENERVNVEAALSARVLNPQVRLVVRSAKQNLNQLLAHQLGNFVAFEPTQLSASAFALAAFGAAILGFFQLGEYSFQVVKQELPAHHPWCNTRAIHELNSRTRRVLKYIPGERSPASNLASSPSGQFHTWLPNTKVQAGDTIITLEAKPEFTSRSKSSKRRSHPYPWRVWQNLRQIKSWRDLQQQLIQLWQSNYEQQIRRVAIICGLTVLGLGGIGTILLHLAYPGLTLLDAFYATVVLLLGGYGDLFGDLAATLPIPGWLRLFNLSLTLAGTAFIGVLYALLTEKLLTLKFQFLARRPPLPTQDHVVIIWLGRVGRRVATLLQELKQPVVGITNQALESDILPQMPLIVGDIANALTKANLATAKSVVAVSEDEIQNLEMGLVAHRINPDCGLIIRTYDQRFSDKVAQLFQYAQVLCTSALSAEAFAGAAFGENVIDLFRLDGQTILVTEYTVEASDTLKGLLLAEVAYGYGVVPILYQEASAYTSPKLMPSDDVRLQGGDRLFVLATINGLKRIEQGQLAQPHWQIRVERALTQDAAFDGATELACVSGCNISLAREFMQQIPAVFPQRLYRHQALRLVRKLIKNQVHAKVLPFQ